MSSLRRRVPTFSLYGEQSAPSAQADSLHIETIQSRSRKYLWKIETHRHTRLSQLLLLSAGPATVFLDERRYDFLGRAAVIIPTGTIHSFQFSPDTHGHVLTFDLQHVLDTAGPAHQMPIQSLFACARATDLSTGAAQFQRLEQLLLALEFEVKQPDSASTPVGGWLACCALRVLAHGSVDDRTVESRGAAGRGISAPVSRTHRDPLLAALAHSTFCTRARFIGDQPESHMPTLGRCHRLRTDSTARRAGGAAQVDVLHQLGQRGRHRIGF